MRGVYWRTRAVAAGLMVAGACGSAAAQDIGKFEGVWAVADGPGWSEQCVDYYEDESIGTYGYLVLAPGVWGRDLGIQCRDVRMERDGEYLTVIGECSSEDGMEPFSVDALTYRLISGRRIKDEDDTEYDLCWADRCDAVAGISAQWEDDNAAEQLAARGAGDAEKLCALNAGYIDALRAESDAFEKEGCPNETTLWFAEHFSQMQAEHCQPGAESLIPDPFSEEESVDGQE